MAGVWIWALPAAFALGLAAVGPASAFSLEALEGEWTCSFQSRIGENGEDMAINNTLWADGTLYGEASRDGVIVSRNTWSVDAQGTPTKMRAVRANGATTEETVIEERTDGLTLQHRLLSLVGHEQTVEARHTVTDDRWETVFTAVNPGPRLDGVTTLDFLTRDCRRSPS